MKLKTRLKFAFFAAILVPILLFALTGYVVTKIQIRAIEKTYGVHIDLPSFAESPRILSEATDGEMRQIQRTARSAPEDLLDFMKLQELNESLRGKYSYLLIRKDSQIYYCGTEEDVSWILEDLPDYGSSGDSGEVGFFIDKERKVMTRQVDFSAGDGSQYSAFIVSLVGVTLPEVRWMLIQSAAAAICILILTAALMVAWIYSGINAPLNQLKEAANRITAGDLDFSLEADMKGKGDDEIHSLFRDFEAMRKRLKESEEEKEKYDRENRELISNISHDLKTPITTVKGYVEGIMDGVADTPEKMDHYIKTIYNKACDMDRLVNELTFYSKIDTNRIPYNFQRINVADYFQDCAEEVCIELEEQGISFSYDNMVDPSTMVIADAEQMKRVIGNIISNSVKYMDKAERKIQLRIRDVGDFIQVEIEDNGKGIDARDLPKIFDRFYRTDASRNSSRGGSGIGLSIVRKIVEDHGGRIWAGATPGRGTTMYFVLRKYQEVLQ